MTALIKYASLMESYAEFMDKADDYDTDDMSAADAKYYIDTMARIEKRMIDATYNSGYWNSSWQNENWFQFDKVAKIYRQICKNRV